jgi:prephenate dehydratase/chorismate mutase
MEDLDKLRGEINRLDQELLKIIAERMRVVEEIGRLKGESGKPVTDTKRETEVYGQIDTAASRLGIDKSTARRIFYEIIQFSKSKQFREKEGPLRSDLKLKMVFQGEHGAYSEAALKKAFPNAEPVPSQTFHSVFEALEKGDADAALLPVENSTEGSVTPVYDLLMESDTKAFQEVFLRVEHCLMARPGVVIGDLKEVYSHPQALEQCRGLFKRLGAKPVPYYDTAGAAKMVKESGRNDIAAIASELAASHYGLDILGKGIEDNPNNITRFLALGRGISEKPVKSRRYKTSLVFAIRHEPGSLFSVVRILAERGINLTKLESRPTKKTPWEYVFFVDFEGHAEEEQVKEVLKQVEEKTLFMKVFGSYVRGD